MTSKIEKMAVELLEAIRKEKEVQKVERGATVTVADREWIILKVEDDKVHCLLKDLMDSREFDSECNDYRVSGIRYYLNTNFLEDLLKEVEVSQLHTITTDLLSLDGQKEYEQCEDKVSLLTVDMYRENRDILPNMDEWWWLATPWSTKCNGYETAVCCVSAGGSINCSCSSSDAVRPFCIFDSSIFES